MSLALTFAKSGLEKRRYHVLLFSLLTIVVCGCGSAATTPAEFEGRWRQYESPVRRFVEFRDGRITIENDADSQSGTYEFELIDDSEPLYRVRAAFPGDKKEFELYFERDTISLMGLSKELDGLYEISFKTDPNVEN